MLKLSLQNKIKKKNKKQLVRCKGAHDNQVTREWLQRKKKYINTRSGRGVTTSARYYDVSKWEVCLATQVPVQISIAPVAATLTAVESH